MVLTPIRPALEERLCRRRWTYLTELFFLAGAYLTAVLSLLSYVHFEAGTGRPSRLQMVLIGVPVVILYYLSLRTAHG